MSKDAPVSVRFGADITDRLDHIAAQTGIPKAELVRRATVDYLDKVESEGRITIIVREPRAACGKATKKPA